MIRSSNVQGTDAGPSANIHILYYDDITKQAGNEGVALGSKTLEEYVGLSQNNFFEPKKISFAGQTAFRGREAGLYDMDAIWIQKDAHLYKIWLVSDVGMTSDLSAQILSTFKFTR